MVNREDYIEVWKGSLNIVKSLMKMAMNGLLKIWKRMNCF